MPALRSKARTVCSASLLKTPGTSTISACIAGGMVTPYSTRTIAANVLSGPVPRHAMTAAASANVAAHSASVPRKYPTYSPGGMRSARRAS